MWGPPELKLVSFFSSRRQAPPIRSLQHHLHTPTLRFLIYPVRFFFLLPVIRIFVYRSCWRCGPTSSILPFFSDLRTRDRRFSLGFAVAASNIWDNKLRWVKNIARSVEFGVACFICRAPDHIAKNCLNKSEWERNKVGHAVARHSAEQTSKDLWLTILQLILIHFFRPDIVNTMSNPNSPIFSENGDGSRLHRTVVISCSWVRSSSGSTSVRETGRSVWPIGIARLSSHTSFRREKSSSAFSG